MQNALIRIVAAAGSPWPSCRGAVWAQGPSDANRYAYAVITQLAGVPALSA
jgi:hypothetical protein